MGFILRDALGLVLVVAYVALVAAIPFPEAGINPGDFHSDDIITRDICIIGGGSGGTYSAIRLRELGKSVVVVEKQDRLGGHTQTYIDPASGTPVDYGVVVWHDLPLVRNYFAHFNITLAKVDLNALGGATQYVDFRTGKVVTPYSPADPAVVFATYAAQLAKYPYLTSGFYLPDPVPADLLLPFGSFIKKYAIDAAVQTIFSITQGIGNLLTEPTIYVMMVMSPDLLRNLEIGFLGTAQHDNSLLYEAAQTELGNDALLSSQVREMDRDSGPDVKMVVDTPSGCKLICAKKVIIAIPPKLRNLERFDLDDTERGLFGQFNNAAYYTSLLRHTGIPDGLWLTNIGANTTDNLPPLPGVYGVSPTGVQGLVDVKYGSPTELSDEEVKRNIIADILRLKNNNLTINVGDFATFSSHSPFQLTVSTGAIARGFYKQLYALQGRRKTFYTGAAWIAHDSSLIWNFTESLLPSIIA